MTATYPTDVIFDVNTFAVIGSVLYSNTGTGTQFNLAGRVNHRGEVLAFADGILQDTIGYLLINAGATVDFLSAPNASNLTLKNISVPNFLMKTIEYTITARSVSYNNTSPVILNSNTYLVDGVRTAWSLPANIAVGSKDSILLSITGVQQIDSSFTFPSATLGDLGLDLSPAVPSLAGNNTIQIRTFFDGQDNMGSDRCRDLGNFKPDKGFGEDRVINSLIFESQVGYEKRRLVSRRKKTNWTLTYTNISGTIKDALETFYDARGGETSAFFFDLTHINETGTAVVRFEGPLKIKHNHSISSALNDNFYTIDITLKETYD